MAQVDFSNAVLTPLLPQRSPLFLPYVALYASGEAITNINGVPITSSFSKSLLKNERNEFVVSYSGTLNTSGTEFYIAGAMSSSYVDWRVSNISFASGDTFVLQIKCNLTTN